MITKKKVKVEVAGSACRVPGVGLMEGVVREGAEGLWFRVQGAGCRVDGGGETSC